MLLRTIMLVECKNFNNLFEDFIKLSVEKILN